MRTVRDRDGEMARRIEFALMIFCDSFRDYESDSEKSSTPTTSPIVVRPIASPGSSWAPEQFSILSWNLDGLDEKNLDARTEYVVEHVLK